MKDEHLIDFLAFGMLVYTGWRTYDYMWGNLQDVGATTATIISLAFLMFSEVAFLVWLHKAQPAATTSPQETAANIMIWVDFAGSMALNLADLAVHNKYYAVDLTAIDPILFFAPWVLVVVNVAAYIVYKTNDSTALMSQAERRLKHAEHKAEMTIRSTAIADVNNRAQATARRIAPMYRDDIEQRIEESTARRFGKNVPPKGKPETNHTAGEDIPVSSNGVGDNGNPTPR